MQQFPGLKFKKYLLVRIFNVYFGEYLEINRLIICLSCKLKKKDKSIYFIVTMSPLPYLLKRRVYIC